MTGTSPEVREFIVELAACCHGVRSVWVMNSQCDLIVFADAAGLQSLRAATALHRPGMRVRVVTDSEHFDLAWGDAPEHGSLTQWDWMQPTLDEAFYSEAQRGKGRGVTRVRRRAACVWRPS